MKQDKPKPQALVQQTVTDRAVLVKSHPDFRYSKCTGRKKALCVSHRYPHAIYAIITEKFRHKIGINYRGQSNELRGCINDARHMRDFLISMCALVRL
jgi:hypothetical protein